TPCPAIYTLSLHDALPISLLRPELNRGEMVLVAIPGEIRRDEGGKPQQQEETNRQCHDQTRNPGPGWSARIRRLTPPERSRTCRSEEHTSELQSRSDLVCR